MNVKESLTPKRFELNKDKGQQGVEYTVDSSRNCSTNVANFGMKAPLEMEHGIMKLLDKPDGLNDDMEGVWMFVSVRGAQSNTLATYIESNEVHALQLCRCERQY
jgi:hypothetical protein